MVDVPNSASTPSLARFLSDLNSNPIVDQSRLFQGILNAAKEDMKLILLEMLHSTTLIDDTITRQTESGPRREPIKRERKMPTERRQCPECKKTLDDYSWEVCNPKEDNRIAQRLSTFELQNVNRRLEDTTKDKEIAELKAKLEVIEKTIEDLPDDKDNKDKLRKALKNKEDIESELQSLYKRRILPNPRDLLLKEELENKLKMLETAKVPHENAVPTIWLDWNPLVNDKGFPSINTAVLANLGASFSSGNLDEKDMDSIKRYSLGIAGDVDEMIFEHPEWQGPQKLTRSTRVMLESTLAKNIQIVLSRAIDAYFLERMSQSTKVEEQTISDRRPGMGQEKKGGILSTLGRWMST